MSVPDRNVSGAPYGSITSTPARIKRRLAIKTFTGLGVRGGAKVRSTIRGRRPR